MLRADDGTRVFGAPFARISAKVKWRVAGSSNHESRGIVTLACRSRAIESTPSTKIENE